jgi:hypothetical protein
MARPNSSSASSSVGEVTPFVCVTVLTSFNCCLSHAYSPYGGYALSYTTIRYKSNRNGNKKISPAYTEDIFVGQSGLTL